MEFNRKGADGLRDLKEKHGVALVRTPEDVLIEHWKAWDKIAQDEAAKDPFFKKVLESQKAYAGLVVPARRFTSSYELTGSTTGASARSSSARLPRRIDHHSIRCGPADRRAGRTRCAPRGIDL
jgi:hypothetical protein